GDHLVGTFTPAGASYQSFTTGQFTVATAGSHTLSFVGLNPQGGDNTAFLDDLTLTPWPSFSVPGDRGFEAPAVGSGAFAYNPSGSPWTFSGTSGVSGNGSAFTSGNPNAPEGSQVAFLQETGAIGQTLNLAAGAYTLSFQAAQRGNQSSNQTF